MHVECSYMFNTVRLILGKLHGKSWKKYMHANLRSADSVGTVYIIVQYCDQKATYG